MINEDNVKDLKTLTYDIDAVLNSVAVTMEETAKAIVRLRRDFGSMRNNVEILTVRAEMLRDTIKELEDELDVSKEEEIVK